MTTDERLDRIEELLLQLVRQKTLKEWYTTAEAAEILERAEWTVREWCRLHRVNASKRPCGRGNSQEWIISHEELQRIRNEGLLPDPRLIARHLRSLR
jgi:hypothetical protein